MTAKAGSAGKQGARRRRPLSAAPLAAEQPELAPFPVTGPGVAPAGFVEGGLPDHADNDAAAAAPEEPAAAARPSPKRPRRRTALRTLPLHIPPILLEGDAPNWPSAGPGEKFALGPTPPAGPRGHEAAELPEAYGTGKLTLIARDPHWLYAHWDLMPQQQRRYNALSADRHLVVRVLPGTVADHPGTDIHVHPESRSWFIHVERAGTRYSVELGYYPPNRQWVTIATSRPAVTPRDTVSQDRTLRFATIPPEVPLRQLAAPRKPSQATKSPPPEAAQGRVLAEAIERYQAQQEPANSIAIQELLRGLLQGEAPPPPPAFPLPAGGPIVSISSPSGGKVPPPRAFWLNLNAELILYGATEPGASLTIGGLPIALRPDGTFSFHFSMPDGDYDVSVSAQSAEGDCRQAVLKFSRRTACQGDVGAASQDPTLNPPASDIP